VAINYALSLKADRRDVIANLKSFWESESEMQKNPMPFHLDSLWGFLERVRWTGNGREYYRWVKTPVLL